MWKSRFAMAFTTIALLVTACTDGSASTTEALLAPRSTTVASIAPSSETASPARTLVGPGCDVFDAEELGRLTPIDKTMQLVESNSAADELTCNFVRAGDGLDTGVRIEVELLSSHPDGHFTTPGQVESPITIADRPGVGFGRGGIRVQLDGTRGMTLVVTIRSIGATGVIPRDGEYLDIRDTIAVYVINSLN